MRSRRRSEPESIFALQQFYRSVGERVRDARKRANNMTQKALAMTIGLTRTSLTNIEKGRQKILLHTFSDLAVALGVDPVDLLPKKEKVLTGLGVTLPDSLAPDERGFIERAIGAGGTYEIKPTKIDSIRSSRAPSKKQYNRSTG
jgi:transcriptional regulator with XRE-family HTH domain